MAVAKVADGRCVGVASFVRGSITGVLASLDGPGVLGGCYLLGAVESVSFGLCACFAGILVECDAVKIEHEVRIKVVVLIEEREGIERAVRSRLNSPWWLSPTLQESFEKEIGACHVEAVPVSVEWEWPDNSAL